MVVCFFATIISHYKEIVKKKLHNFLVIKIKMILEGDYPLKCNIFREVLKFLVGFN
jgi:hypothetical protein